jgi:alpha-glucosidase
MGLGLSGIPFSGSDIGGCRGSTTPELYTRWMQIGALSPLARTHNARFARRQEPWRFGKDTLAIARDALRLRMRLLPYLYALFRHSEGSGAPIWRSLAYEFPFDPAAGGVDDQVMIGPSLLAAPVLESGQREREVYLPAGDWIDWHDGARYTGARRVCVDAPIERLPLFARGGSVLPTRSPVRNTLAIPDEPLVLEVFPGADANLELVEDDGESVAYQGDVVARTPIRLWTRAGGRLRLELGRREGPYAIATRPLRICVNACPTPNAVYLDGAPLPSGANAPGWLHDDAGRLQIRLLDEGVGCALEVDPAP